jgi:hypothetical protein
MEIFPAFAIPNVDQNLDQKIIVNSGVEISAANFFEMLGGAKELRLMARTRELNEENPPCITWQYFKHYRDPIVSVAYPATVDRDGRIIYSAIISILNDFYKSEVLKSKLPLIYADSRTDFALEYIRQSINDISEHIITKKVEFGVDGGEYKKKDIIKRYKIRKNIKFIILLLLAIVIFLLVYFTKSYHFFE